MPAPVPAHRSRPVVAALLAVVLALGSFLAVLTLGTGTATAESSRAATSGCGAAQQDLADAKAAVASDTRAVKRWKRTLRRADTSAQERRARRKLRQAKHSLRLQREWRADAQRVYDDCLAGTPSPTSPTADPTAPTSTATTTPTTSPTTSGTPSPSPTPQTCTVLGVPVPCLP